MLLTLMVQLGSTPHSLRLPNSVNSLTATTRVAITDVPISNLAARNSSPTFIGHATAFTATVGSGSNVVYLWDFGDGSATASGMIVTHTYGAVGVYTTSITATNSLSSLATTTRVTIADVPISNLAAYNSGPTILGHATTFTATVGSGLECRVSMEFRRW